MSGPSVVPSVVVERAPDGWTHIGGPGMHLLIGLDEDDERTLTASDAADGGDIDDVIDVLTAGGMRRAHHFVGVHWEPCTRIVAFGPVGALVTLADGSEHDVRAASARVWTDVELPEHPERVVLRVLEESERSLPAPPGHLAAGAPVPPSDTGAGPAAEPPAAVTPPVSAALPTFGAAAAHDDVAEAAPGSSTWGRSWARHDGERTAAGETGRVAGENGSGAGGPVPAPGSPVTPQPRPEAVAAIRSWGSVAPVVPVRVTGQRDVDSTWAARPVPGTAASPEARATPTSTPAPPPRPDAVSAQPTIDGDDTRHGDHAAHPVAAPSYDYLFGHTTAADEHRKVLAQLTRPADEDGGHEDDVHQDDEHEDDGVLSVPAVADASNAAVTNAAPAPEVPQRPIPSAPDLPEGGLISSVPWATPATAAPPEPGADVPTFAGRHTPPAAPSLLPPVNTPAPVPLSATPAVARPAVSCERTLEVPSSGGVPSGAAPEVSEDDDEAELTVDRSALLEGRNALQAQTFSGPTVLAVLCSAGHPTPPHSDRCRVCGAGIPAQEPFTMPRPPLGVLRLSTGDVVTLDRSVLLGRAPKPGEGLSAHERPHVVKVPSPERDVSRNHVEVILEGWHVLIRDLGTTNGTTVTLPGEAPVRLRAHDQQVLEPGSLVSMADEVSFVFESAL